MSVGYCQRRNPTGLNYFCHFNLIFFFAVCNFVVPREGRLKTTKPLPASLMPSFKLVLPTVPVSPTSVAQQSEEYLGSQLGWARLG